MSELMPNFSQIRNCLINVPKKQLIVPKYKNLLQPRACPKKRDSKIVIEEIAMIKMIKKLTHQQVQKIHQENERVIRKKFSQLKKNMNKQVNKNKNNFQIEKFFKEKAKQVGLINDVVHRKCEIIDIQKKYQTKITNRRSIVAETLEIEKSKSIYRKLFSSQHTNPLYSPIFKMMISKLKRTKKSRLPTDSEQKPQVQKYFKQKYRFSCETANSRSYQKRIKQMRGSFDNYQI